jgi:hypothetical protein
LTTHINWKSVANNIAEAREQLEQLEIELKQPRVRHEATLQMGLEHALHHLYFAWNVRRINTKSYRSMTDREFNRWSKVPKDLQVTFIKSEKGTQ